MAVNKVIYGDSTLIDITDSTVDAEHLMSGYTAYDASGQKITGAATSSAIIIDTPESHGGTIRDITVTDTVKLEGQKPVYITSLPQTVTPDAGYDGFSSVIAQRPVNAEEKDVNFIDYDGTILYSYTEEEVFLLTELPANPIHEGLTSQGWNWTLAEIKSQLTNVPGGEVWVGQMYVTASGETEIDIELVKGFTSPYLFLWINGEVSIDWGDGSERKSSTGTGGNYIHGSRHTYSKEGFYTIKISVVNGSFGFLGLDNVYGTLTAANNSSSSYNRAYTRIVAVRIGTGISSIGDYSFYYNVQMRYITIPNTITYIGIRAFSYCDLSSITIPRGITTINSYTFAYSSELSSISLPNSVSTIDTYAMAACYRLHSFTLPYGITQINNYLFSSVYSLGKIVIPEGVTGIGIGAFSNCTGFYGELVIPSTVSTIGNNAFYSLVYIASYHLLPTTPPTLGTTVFGSIPEDCIIYVPYSEDHSILEAYQIATNWSTYASHMQEEPQS